MAELIKCKGCGMNIDPETGKQTFEKGSEMFDFDELTKDLELKDNKINMLEEKIHQMELREKKTNGKQGFRLFE